MHENEMKNSSFLMKLITVAFKTYKSQTWSYRTLGFIGSLFQKQRQLPGNCMKMKWKIHLFWWNSLQLCLELIKAKRGLTEPNTPVTCDCLVRLVWSGSIIVIIENGDTYCTMITDFLYPLYHHYIDANDVRFQHPSTILHTSFICVKCLMVV